MCFVFDYFLGIVKNIEKVFIFRDCVFCGDYLMSCRFGDWWGVDDEVLLLCSFMIVKLKIRWLSLFGLMCSVVVMLFFVILFLWSVENIFGMMRDILCCVFFGL